METYLNGGSDRLSRIENRIENKEDDMVKSFSISHAVIAVMAATFAMAIAAESVPAQAADPVKVRQASTKENSSNMKGIKGFVKPGESKRAKRRAGTAGDVELRAVVMAAAADRIPKLFRERGKGKTRAKPEI